MVKTAQPQELKKVGDQAFKIKWTDDHASEYNSWYLRARCPCALCVNELTGERITREKDISQDLKLVKADIVGQYALSFDFSDHHNTGIYSFEYLRGICPCCQGA